MPPPIQRCSEPPRLLGVDLASGGVSLPAQPKQIKGWRIEWHSCNCLSRSVHVPFVEQAEKLCADAIDADSHGICGCPWLSTFSELPWASISEAG